MALSSLWSSQQLRPPGPCWQGERPFHCPLTGQDHSCEKFAGTSVSGLHCASQEKPTPTHPASVWLALLLSPRQGAGFLQCPLSPGCNAVAGLLRTWLFEKTITINLLLLSVFGTGVCGNGGHLSTSLCYSQRAQCCLVLGNSLRSQNISFATLRWPKTDTCLQREDASTAWVPTDMKAYVGRGGTVREVKFRAVPQVRIKAQASLANPRPCLASYV